MRRPSFQFYPQDWSGNSNLRRCSHAEKGVWVDVMCLMHDQEGEYGILRWPLKEIAQAVGCTMPLIKGLVTKGVIKGDDKLLSDAFVYIPRSGRKDGEPVTLVDTQAGPIWYSSRMVKDEYIRTIRGESSRFGADKSEDLDSPKASPKAAPKPPFGDGSSTSSSSSPSVNTVPIGTDGAAVKPAKVTDPSEIIFGYGVPLLTQAGSADKHARSFLGGLRKTHGDSALVDALRECIKAKPLQPMEWLAAALPPSGAAPRTVLQPNRQEALEQRGQSVVDAWANEGDDRATA